MQNTYEFKSRVSFYDTDAMGVMHHASYLRKFEDARVSWLRETGLNQHHYPQSDLVLAVIKADVKYRLPTKYEDEITVELKISKTRLKLFIDYVMKNESQQVVATGQTVHVPLNKELQLCEYPVEMENCFKRKEING